MGLFHSGRLILASSVYFIQNPLTHAYLTLFEGGGGGGDMMPPKTFLSALLKRFGEGI